MRNKQRALYLISAILILAMASLACGTGYSTSSKLSGNSGEIRVKLASADGQDTHSVEINEDWSWQRVSTTVSATAEEGSCRVALTGGENTAIVLDAAAGSPGQSYGDLVTDGFGEVSLQSECSGAKNLEVTIAFSRK
jgi:hypothetical protein